MLLLKEILLGIAILRGRTDYFIFFVKFLVNTLLKNITQNVLFFLNASY